MAGKFSDAWLEELRSRVPLEEVVSEYVPLKQKGRRFWGCCPFHHEKTASFSVDTEAQMYYCFGCHKGGTVFTFVMEMERVEFQECVENLAERAHMQVPQITREIRDTATADERERIYEVNTLAARFFHALLWTDEGAEALNYLYKRGLNDGDIRRFGLGAAPKGWQTLADKLVADGYPLPLLEKAGLVVRKEGRTYDMFRNRAVFPIINQGGKVVGFGGRIMGDGQPKYLNTSETPVFNKRQGLYCLNMAKKERDAGHLVLVEGYMDTVSLRRNGVKGVVATLGTALTEEQVRLIKRFTSEVWISYDGDGAGQKAALRALDMFDAENVTAKVIDYPKGMDPDDFVKAYGKAGFDDLPKLSSTDYRMLRAKDDADISTLDGMTKYAMRCCEIIRGLKDPIVAENYLRRLVSETGYDRSVLLRQIGTIQTHTPRTPSNHVQRKTLQNAAPSVKVSQNERILLTLLGNGVISADMLKAEDFTEGFSRNLANLLLSGKKANAILDSLTDPQELNAAAEAFNYSPVPGNPEDAKDMAANVLDAIHKEHLDERMKEIQLRSSGVSQEERYRLYEQIQSMTERMDTM